MEAKGQHSVYNTGANDGLTMGIYLSALFLLQSVGMNYPILALIGSLMTLGIPFIAYYMLNKGYRATNCYWGFSGIWLHGIVMFLCGSLIMAIVMYVYMKFVNPTYMVDQVNLVIKTYNEIGTAEAKQFAHTLEMVIEKRLMPSAISLSFTMIWFIGFVGAMLSMAIAFIIKYIVRPKPRR